MNEEFVDLIKSAGWTQAEAARQLGMTSGAVNQIVKGSVRASPITMRLLKLMLGGPLPEAEMDWKRRALAAEEALKSVHLITSKFGTMPKGISSVQSTEANERPKQISSDAMENLEAQTNKQMGKELNSLLELQRKTQRRRTATSTPSKRNNVRNSEGVQGPIPH